jgi:biotin carboxyl carrier protein
VAKHEVRTPVGGTVCVHSVGVGQRVCAGALLLICEMMKCEFPVEAPVNGEVTWLRPCGETIEVDDVVAILDS